MDAKIAELLQASKDALAASVATKDAVALIPPAVDALEAAITDLKTKTNLSPEDAAAIDETLATVRSVTTAAVETTGTATTAAADAADGINEAAPGLTPTP